jgi:hypothetical protein
MLRIKNWESDCEINCLSNTPGEGVIVAIVILAGRDMRLPLEELASPCLLTTPTTRQWPFPVSEI